MLQINYPVAKHRQKLLAYFIIRSAYSAQACLYVDRSDPVSKFFGWLHSAWLFVYVCECLYAVVVARRTVSMCASGCVVECRTCNREFAGLNFGLGYFAPRSTQPSIPPGSVNEFQVRLGRQRQVQLIPIADERQGVQVKLCYPLKMRVIPERLRDASCGGAIQIDYLYLYV